ncbi:PilW family protein [Shewanella kaireitica]|uniref:PilW family protein n=1 Tax=Shewanella kaireitica TaxID=212021 RepID=UPI00200E6E59|nr:type II secretion system protein [Shewanella kaireitica]MCL1094154.1 type II secretion system GspH family protein [Shewanella kaireitica]
MSKPLTFALHRNRKMACKSRGFTLVEMVTVVIILGILVLGVSSFLIFGTRIFIDSTSVEQVMSQSRFAIERMTRDIRNAVPNSIRVRSSGNDWQCVEMMPIASSASYILAPVAPLPAANTAIVMQASNSAPLTKDQQLLIYPLRPADVYTSANGITGKLFTIKEVTNSALTNATTVEFDKTVQFSEMSPRQRYFGVAGAVSYCFEKVTDELALLNRYAGYGFNNPTTQPSPANMGPAVLMAENIENTIASNEPMAYTPGTLQNNAMVHLNPLFDVQGQALQYHHQVQVINVP